MRRVEGTLALKSRESRRDPHRDGSHSFSSLVGSDGVADTQSTAELQAWTKHLERAVSAFLYRQRQREACDRARLAIARRTAFGEGVQ
jgi:hypothetical protein